MKVFCIPVALLGAAFTLILVASPAFANRSGGALILAANSQVGRPAHPGDTDRGNSEQLIVHHRAKPHVGRPAHPYTGKPAKHGDTDRGRSEGKGHNDRMHTNNGGRR